MLAATADLKRVECIIPNSLKTPSAAVVASFAPQHCLTVDATQIRAPVVTQPQSSPHATARNVHLRNEDAKHLIRQTSLARCPFFSHNRTFGTSALPNLRACCAQLAHTKREYVRLSLKAKTGQTIFTRVAVGKYHRKTPPEKADPHPEQNQVSQYLLAVRGHCKQKIAGDTPFSAISVNIRMHSIRA